MGEYRREIYGIGFDKLMQELNNRAINLLETKYKSNLK